MLTFRPPETTKDFAAMSRIHARGWRATYPGDVPEDYLSHVIVDDFWVETFRAGQADGSQKGLMAFDGSRLVSCLTYGPVRSGATSFQSLEHNIDASGYDGWGEIQTFYSDPDLCGRGYGGALLEEACRRLKADGYRNVYLFVLDNKQRARRFYERHAFAWDGTFENIPFPHGYVCKDLRYVRSLDE